MTQEKYSIIVNLKLEDDPNIDLGVIFTVRDGSFSEFEITLLATNNKNKKLVLGISDAVGEKKTWNVVESKETKNPFYVIVQIERIGSGAKFQFYLNKTLICDEIRENFFWPTNFNPKLILGSPIGGTYPCKISEVIAYERFLSRDEINELGVYLQKKENNSSFEKSLELKLGNHAEIK